MLKYKYGEEVDYELVLLKSMEKENNMEINKNIPMYMKL
jgi:hypothetical protein